MSHASMERWTWDSRWCLPGDSFAAKIWRLQHANLIEGRDLMRTAFGSGTMAARGGRFGQRPAAQIQELCRIMRVAPAARDASLLANLQSAFGEWTYSARGLRYCPECLMFGYHSAYFQIEALAACPIHQLPLLDVCRQCGAEGPDFGWCLDLLGHPYSCPHCGDWLAGRAPSLRNYAEPLVSREKLDAVWSPLDAWVNSVTDLPIRYASLREWVLHDPGYERSRRIDAIHVVGAIRALPDHPLLWTAPSVKRKAISLVGVGMQERARWLENTAVATLYRRARATIERRALRGRVEDISSQCGRLGWQVFATGEDGDMDPAAKAYVLWRMYFENLASPDLLRGATDKEGVYIDDETVPCPVWSLSHGAWTIVFHAAYRSIAIDVERAPRNGMPIGDVLRRSPTRHCCTLPGVDLRGREAGYFVYCTPEKPQARGLSHG